MEHDGAEWISYGVLALVLVPLLAALWRSGFFGRLMRLVEEVMLGNWQLAVLGATAIALSLASGYTTFDGLRNFTAAPLLSALVTFGIQGVMLIVSWLIGESFAAGMSRQAPRTDAPSTREAALGLGLGAVLAGLVLLWALSRHDAIDFVRGSGGILAFRADWQRLADVALYFLTALTLIGLVILAARRGSEMVQPYVRGVRIIVKDAALWVMLLATMGCSVFFSFDSHFSAIFPAEQRKRAAEIRTLNQVAGIVADIGGRALKVRSTEAERLLESEGWKAYDAQLSALADTARGVQTEIEAVLVARLEERQRGIGEQQERIAAAERSRTALLRKRDELEAELQRLEASVGALEAELAKAQAAHDESRQAMAAKEIEASAEDGGVEGTLKRGRGPIWRQRMAELEALRRKLDIADTPRLHEAQRRRNAASARIVSLKREIATIIGHAAKHSGAIATAKHRIEAARESETDRARVDPARMLLAFERTRDVFRQRPEPAALAAVAAQCAALLGALSDVPAAREKARGIDCNAKAASQAAARVFALNAGLAAFEAGCAGGSKVPQDAGTDALLAFGRKCLQDSGLVSKETADFASRMQAIEMNRDDKAHRFVVTWNALVDGSRLGYLALALAIGIDSLVFMAGLFGAAAARSPLSDVPNPRARSAEQLEAIVRNALGESRLDSAELVLAAMRPAPGDDLRSEVDLTGFDGERAARIRKVLVAGRSIGAVERAAGAPGEERYLVRPELLEFLSTVANSAREPERARADRTRLANVVGVALEPDRPGSAAIVLRHAEPIEPRRGFMAKVDLDAIAKEKDRRLVQSVLGAGMSAGGVVRQTTRSRLWPLAFRQPAQTGTAYLISAELFETLLQHRASAPAAPTLRGDARPVRLTAVDTPSDYAGYEPVAAPIVAGRRLLADGRAAPEPWRERDVDELRRHFHAALLEEVGSEVKAAAANLGQRPGTHPRAALERIAREATRALQRAARTLAREHPNDEQAQALLRETCREIAGDVRGLLLALLEETIAEAEGMGDNELPGRLRRLRDDIATLDPGDTG